jgi:hypothetical protein
MRTWLTRFWIVRWWLGGTWTLMPSGKMSYGWMEHLKRRGDE